jgi:hypothetical protein
VRRGQSAQDEAGRRGLRAVKRYATEAEAEAAVADWANSKLPA